MEIATIGLDLPKQVFQVQGVDEPGHAVVKRHPRRAQVIRYFASLPPRLIGMEACATAAQLGRLRYALAVCSRFRDSSRADRKPSKS
jgi:transposase